MIVRSLKNRLKMPEEVVKRYNKFTVKSMKEMTEYIDRFIEDPKWRKKELYFHPKFFRYKTISRPGKSWYTYYKELGFDALKQNKLTDADFEYENPEVVPEPAEEGIYSAVLSPKTAKEQSIF